MPLGAGKIRIYAMINSASASSRTLRDATIFKVEAGLPLFGCPYTCTSDMPESIEW